MTLHIVETLIRLMKFYIMCNVFPVKDEMHI